MSPDAAAPPPPPRQSMAVGIAWVLGFRILDRITGIASVMVLARLLVPDDFGLVALGTSVAAFVELLGAFSLDAVLIQKKDATRADFDTAWTIQVGIGAACATVLALVAPLAAGFFRQPDLRTIITILAAAMLVDGFANIRVIEFRKLMRFDREFIFMAGRRLATTAVTITAAFLLRNHWALVIGIASGKLVGLTLGYAMRPYRPRFTLASHRELLHASWWLFMANLVQFVRMRLSDFVLGRTTTTRIVGSFNLANEVSSMVSTEVVAPVNRVALPEFSAIGDPAGIVRRFDQLTGQLAIFLIPMGIGLAACARPLVDLFFGPNWTVAAEVLSILAISGMVAGLGSNMGVALLAVGHFRTNAALQATGAALLIPLLTLGAMLASYRGAAWAMLVANSLLVVIAAFALRRILGYHLRQFAGCLWRPALCAILMFTVIQPLLGHPGWFWNVAPEATQLAVVAVVGAAVYTGAMLLLFVARGRRDAPEQMTLRFLRSALGKIRSRLSG